MKGFNAKIITATLLLVGICAIGYADDSVPTPPQKPLTGQGGAPGGGGANTEKPTAPVGSTTPTTADVKDAGALKDGFPYDLNNKEKEVGLTVKAADFVKDARKDTKGSFTVTVDGDMTKAHDTPILIICFKPNSEKAKTLLADKDMVVMDAQYAQDGEDAKNVALVIRVLIKDGSVLKQLGNKMPVRIISSDTPTKAAQGKADDSKSGDTGGNS